MPTGGPADAGWPWWRGPSGLRRHTFYLYMCSGGLWGGPTGLLRSSSGFARLCPRVVTAVATVLGDGPVGPSSVPGVFYGEAAASFGSCLSFGQRRSTRVSSFNIYILLHAQWFRWPLSVVILAHIQGSEIAQPPEDGRPYGDQGRVALKNLKNSALAEVHTC